jgi:four helix bundle protein
MTLRIYSDAIEMVKAAYKAAEAIERSDADLARQLRRSSSSVALNLAEGDYAQKGNRKARNFTALGSAKRGTQHASGGGCGGPVAGESSARR